MKLTFKRLLVTTIIAVFAQASTCFAMITKPQQPEAAPEISYRLPVISAPLMPHAPKIDGNLIRDEWSAAAQSSPLIALDSANASDDSSLFWIGYDKTALYMAFRFNRPPASLEPISGKDPLRVWGDDAFELYLRPQFGARWDFNFAGNAMGVREDGRRESTTDKNWKADWSYAARLTKSGWEGEMAIPFASLSTPAPAAGAVWEMNFFNNRKTPRGEVGAWSWMKSWYALEDFGYLVFGESAPAIRVLQAGEISRDEVGMQMEISNFASQTSTISVETSLLSPLKNDARYFQILEAAANPLGAQAEAKEWVAAKEVAEQTLRAYGSAAQKTQKISVPAGQSRRVFLAHPSSRGAYVLHYIVRDVGSGKILAAAPLPFNRRAPLEIEATPYILKAGIVEVVTDYRKVPGVQAGDHIAIEWRRGDRVLSQLKSEVDVEAQQSLFKVPVRGQEAGLYSIRATISAADGTSRGEREQEFRLPAIPVWWKNQIGKPEAKDIVPPPWTPIEKTANGFKVWNRKIELGENSQPAQITAASTPMLAQPARLEIGATGLKLSALEVVKQKKTGLDYRQKISAQNFSGELLLETEFDGFMKYSVHLTPNQNAAATLEKLVLEIPIKPELATHFRHGHLGTPPSQAQAESTYNYGTVGKDGLNLPFTSTVWLGNDEMGLEWCAQSDQWWTPQEKNRAVQIVSTPQATILRINLVNDTRVLRAPVSFQWAILPTPVKPMNEELLHDLRYAQSGWLMNKELTGLDENTDRWIDALVEADVNGYNQFSWENAPSVWNPEGWSAPNFRGRTPADEARRKAFRDANERAYAKGIKWVTTYAIFSSVFPDWPRVGSLWKEMAVAPHSPSLAGTYMFSPSDAFNDWYIFELAQMIEDTKINGVYLDSSASARLDTQLHNGNGYIDESGKLHGTYPVFGLRELHKRIYTLFHGEKTEGGLVYAHNSHFPFMAIESFADVHHCGEGSHLKREYFIPKFYGRPFGIPVAFTRWNNPVYPEKRIHSWRVALQLNSTIKVHPDYVVKSTADHYKRDYVMGRENAMKGYEEDSLIGWKIWQAQKNFPFKDAQWIPAWRAAPYAQTGDADLWPCLHLVNGKTALLVVSSFKDKAADVNLKLDWKKLGFDPAKVEVVDSITDEVLQPTAHGLNFQVLDNRWRMFTIRAR